MSYYFSKTIEMPFSDAITVVTDALAAKGFGVLTTMLPCNVVVREAAPGKVEVAAVDPVASMASVDNPQLGEVAAGVRDLLAETVRQL